MGCHPFWQASAVPLGAAARPDRFGLESEIEVLGRVGLD